MHEHAMTFKDFLTPPQILFKTRFSLHDFPGMSMEVNYEQSVIPLLFVRLCIYLISITCFKLILLQCYLVS